MNFWASQRVFTRQRSLATKRACRLIEKNKRESRGMREDEPLSEAGALSEAGSEAELERLPSPENEDDQLLPAKLSARIEKGQQEARRKKTPPPRMPNPLRRALLFHVLCGVIDISCKLCMHRRVPLPRPCGAGGR